MDIVQIRAMDSSLHPFGFQTKLPWLEGNPKQNHFIELVDTKEGKPEIKGWSRVSNFSQSRVLGEIGKGRLFAWADSTPCHLPNNIFTILRKTFISFSVQALFLMQTDWSESMPVWKVKVPCYIVTYCTKGQCAIVTYCTKW